MQTLDVQQSTPEWHAARAGRFCASEAAAMMGVSPYMTRTELLRQKKTGIAPEVDAGTQRRFDDGHNAEAVARPQAEAYLQEDLFPATGILDIDGLPLLASLDGITMDESVVFECKLHSKKIEAMIESAELLPEYFWQVEQQLLVSGAQRALFVGCDGETIRGQLWYESVPERRAQLIAGWKQFQSDLAEYVPQEIIPAAVAAPQEQLPAVVIQVGGALTVQDNLVTFGDRLRAYVGGINQKPETDQDFADLEAAAKTLKKAEDALKQAVSGALASVADIEQMQRTAAELIELSSGARLMADRLVKSEKENRKVAITSEAGRKLDAHIAGLNQRIGKPFMPKVPADFSGAIKGKKLLSAMQEAVDQVLVNAKLEANAIADRIELNLKAYADMAAGYETLFADLRDLVQKPSEDFGALIAQRIDQHKAAEEKRKEVEAAKAQAQPFEQPKPVPQAGPWKAEAPAATNQLRGPSQMREDINRALYTMKPDDLADLDAYVRRIMAKPIYTQAAA